METTSSTSVQECYLNTWLNTEYYLKANKTLKINS